MLSVDAYKEKNFVVLIIVETPGEDIEVRPAFVRFIWLEFFKMDIFPKTCHFF